MERRRKQQLDEGLRLLEREEVSHHRLDEHILHRHESFVSAYKEETAKRIQVRRRALQRSPLGLPHSVLRAARFQEVRRVPRFAQARSGARCRRVAAQVRVTQWLFTWSVNVALLVLLSQFAGL